MWKIIIFFKSTEGVWKTVLKSVSSEMRSLHNAFRTSWELLCCGMPPPARWGYCHYVYRCDTLFCERGLCCCQLRRLFCGQRCPIGNAYRPWGLRLGAGDTLQEITACRWYFNFLSSKNLSKKFLFQPRFSNLYQSQLGNNGQEKNPVA